MNPATFQFALSRRVAVFCLLVWLASGAGLALGVAWTMHRVHEDRTQSRCLALLGQVTPVLVIEAIRAEQGDWQATVDRLQREEQLLYAAVVSPEGTFAAHSSPGLTGTRAREVPGKRTSWNETEEICFEDEDSIRVREYRAPLRSGDRLLGNLRIAVADNASWGASLLVDYVPLVLLAPALLLAAGLWIIGSTVRPMASIESQLRLIGNSESADMNGLAEIRAKGPAAIGWNRIVGALSSQSPATSDESLLREAISGWRSNRVNHILDSIPEGIAITNPDDEIRIANRAFSASFDAGDDPARVVGTPITRFLNGSANGDSNGERHAALAGTFEITRESAGGQRVLRVARGPLQAPGGQETRETVWTVRDVTQQKLTDRMRDEFLDCATHELRTPLANIKAYAETLALSEVLDIEQQKEFCNTINAEATRLARFIDDLLSISSVESGSLTIQRENVEVRRMLTEVVGKVRPAMEQKDIRFEISLPEKLPEMPLDKDKIQVALVNLLGNATKYTPMGGRVELGVQIAGRELQIAVQDTGVGIAADELPRVFDKFFRSADERVQTQTGTGLGLSLAREIVRLHGGRLVAQSELDKGSRFVMTLPIREQVKR
jgi:two-component system phosphate regulon sensor histidine kinase PhoR